MLLRLAGFSIAFFGSHSSVPSFNVPIDPSRVRTRQLGWIGRVQVMKDNPGPAALAAGPGLEAGFGPPPEGESAWSNSIHGAHHDQEKNIVKYNKKPLGSGRKPHLRLSRCIYNLGLLYYFYVWLYSKE